MIEFEGIRIKDPDEVVNDFFAEYGEGMLQDLGNTDYEAFSALYDDYMRNYLKAQCHDLTYSTLGEYCDLLENDADFRRKWVHNKRVYALWECWNCEHYPNIFGKRAPVGKLYPNADNYVRVMRKSIKEGVV
jgi:hypothetical protein